jgi:uncharacterized protein (TIGR04141 family)
MGMAGYGEHVLAGTEITSLPAGCTASTRPSALASTPDLSGLEQALNHRYLRTQDFAITPTDVAGAQAVVVHGHVPRETAEWCPVLTGLTGSTIEVGYASAGGALVIGVDDAVYALTYGTVGRHMINPDRIDPGFGIGFAIRAIGPERIKRITRSVLASSGRVDRNLKPGGQHIRQFSVEQWGEVIAQLCGTMLANPRLTVTRRSAHARASRSP